MKNTLTITLVIFSGMVLAGCARLDVKVAVLNAEYRHSPLWRAADIQRQADRALDALPAAEKAVIADVERRLDSLADEFGVLDKTLADAGHTGGDYVGTVRTVTSSVSDTLRRTIAQRYGEARAHYREASRLCAMARQAKAQDQNAILATAEIESNQGSDIIQHELPREIQDAIDAINADPGIAAWREDIQALVNFGTTRPAADPARPVAAAASEALEEFDAEVDKAADRAKGKAEQVAKGIVGDGSLFDDPDASRVVNAPPESWKGMYNRAFGTGSLGNTDIAVKMQSAADFTLKGVRVDASQITQASFAAIGQAVQIAAAAYGVPVGGAFPKSMTDQDAAADGGGAAAATEAGASTAGVDDALAAADKTRLDQAALQFRRRAAALRLLSALASEQRILEGTTPTGPTADALRRARASLTQNKAEIEAKAPSATDAN